MPTEIQSTPHLTALLSSNTYVLLDFYASWCGPCHAISPVFSKLSDEHSTPNQLLFAKVDVDAHQDIAAKYGVTAMPTFVVIKDGQVVESIRGANAPALTRAVKAAAAEVARGVKKGAEGAPAPAAASTKSEGGSMLERLGIKLG